MKIVLMNDSHLEEIIEIDFMVFEREEPRTVSNLKGLREKDPEGCYVLLEDDVLVGYSFAKTMGQEGFLGPLGLHPSHHGQGWGKKLIKHSLDYLKRQCKVIGLEVRPDIGDNVGLYHKLGFHSSYPSLILEVPKMFQCNKEISSPNASENESKSYDIELFSELSADRKKLFLNKIEIWTKQNLSGLSFKNDLDLINHGGGDIIIISQDNGLLGVFAHYPVVFPQLWGVIKADNCQKEVLMAGLNFYRENNPQSEFLIGVNSRYNDLVDLLIEGGCKVIKSVNRMLLDGFEGEYNEKSPDFVMRAWHA